MRGIEITAKIVIVTEQCCRCGVVFGISQDMQQRYYNTHETFYCPAGHGQSYNSESETERLHRQLKAVNQQIDTLTARVRHEQDQREGAERILKGTKRELNRVVKRVSKGVCPCCNRTFANLQRHMTGKHPDYQEKASGN